MKYVTVANMNVNIVEHKGQRVLTTEQVADVYGCESRNISDGNHGIRRTDRVS